MESGSVVYDCLARGCGQRKFPEQRMLPCRACGATRLHVRSSTTGNCATQSTLSGGLKYKRLPPRPNWGIDVFKIVETTDRFQLHSRAVADTVSAEQGLSDFCISEEWTANLEDGLIAIGHWTAALHELPHGRCGLTSLTRAYEPADRRHILGLFEQASAAPSSFCYSSTIRLGQGRSQPVFCIARSIRSREAAGLSLGGVFLFPRFKLEEELSDPPAPAMVRFA